MRQEGSSLSESQAKKIIEILGIRPETLDKELHQFHEAKRRKLKKRIEDGKDNKKLHTFTPNSISSVMELKKCLKKVKRDGYAIDKEEFKIGINCLGVPIINKEGKSIASISVTGPSSRFTLSEMKKLKNTLISISKDISHQLDIANIL